MQADSNQTLVTGASSQIGEFLLSRLVEEGHEVWALSRQRVTAGSPDIHWVRGNLADPEFRIREIENARILIHLAPLNLLPAALPGLAMLGIDRLVAFGTTSRFTKSRSSSLEERQLAWEFARAEEGVTRICQTCGIKWTLLRPTMIYGAGTDGTVAFIASVIRRLRCFPLADAARGRRQPVHAEDLAIACLQALASEGACNRSYNLAGGEILEYREMVERIFHVMGRPVCMPQVPAALFRRMLAVVRLVPRFRDLNPGMVERMEQDLVFDSDPARRDFGWSPRTFQPDQRAVGEPC
jgi:nucleoside-diphosphate-sugar epimerase